MTNSDLAARPEPPGDQGSCDIFASIDRAELVEDPYPHLVVENALPQELIDTLLSAMPPQDVFTCGRPPGSNVRFALPSAIALEDSRASETWKTALRTCNAGLASLLAHFVRRLGGHLLRTFPEFAAHIAPLEDMRAVPRAQPARRRNEIGMDAQMVINTPALEGGTSVRGAHLDQPDKLISGLLYLRAADDDSTGGELELFAPAQPGMIFNATNETPPENVRRVRTYPYRHNLLILPLNTPHALHGVSPRSRTAKPRYHLHLVGELSEPLFTIPH